MVEIPAIARKRNWYRNMKNTALMLKEMGMGECSKVSEFLK
jgi:hypothetical protein